jgi:hypothetical protein
MKSEDKPKKIKKGSFDMDEDAIIVSNCEHCDQNCDCKIERCKYTEP